MKKIGIVIVSILILFACNSEEKNEAKAALNTNEVKKDSITIELTLCDCLDSLEENTAWCLENYILEIR